MKKFSIIICFILCSLLIASCGTTESNNKNKNADSTKQQTNDVSQSNNQLGFQLLSKLKEENQDNIFISPYSLFMALSLSYNGADGETKEEIQKVLQTNLNIEKLNEQSKKLFDKINYDNEDMQLKIANSIWLNQQFHFQDQFKENMKNYYKADMEEVDVSSQDTVNRINEWAKVKTNGKIDNIVNYPLNQDLVSLFVNAVYFKGKWMNEFDADKTVKRPFHLADQSTTEVPFMIQKNEWLYFENDMFQAISLPYKNENVSMKVFLPKKQSDLNEFLKNLTIDNWKKWNSEFSKKEGTLLLPKFQLKYEADLNNPLQQLGMKSAFGKTANFSKLIKEDSPVRIGKIKQAAFVDVNEEGTEASAATTISIEITSVNQGFQMEVNRPFFFAIVDESTDVILFMGLIENPNS